MTLCHHIVRLTLRLMTIIPRYHTLSQFKSHYSLFYGSCLLCANSMEIINNIIHIHKHEYFFFVDIKHSIKADLREMFTHVYIKSFNGDGWWFKACLTTWSMGDELIRFSDILRKPWITIYFCQIEILRIFHAAENWRLALPGITILGISKA